MRPLHAVRAGSERLGLTIASLRRNVWHELRLEIEIEAGRCLDVDVHDPRQSGTLEKALDLRAGEPELLCDLLLRPPIDIRPVCNPGKQLVVVRGQGRRATSGPRHRVSKCSIGGRLLTVQSPILDRKVPKGLVPQVVRPLEGLRVREPAWPSNSITSPSSGRNSRTAVSTRVPARSAWVASSTRPDP